MLSANRQIVCGRTKFRVRAVSVKGKAAAAIVESAAAPPEPACEEVHAAAMGLVSPGTGQQARESLIFALSPLPQGWWAIKLKRKPAQWA